MTTMNNILANNGINQGIARKERLAFTVVSCPGEDPRILPTILPLHEEGEDFREALFYLLFLSAGTVATCYRFEEEGEQLLFSIAKDKVNTCSVYLPGDDDEEEQQFTMTRYGGEWRRDWDFLSDEDFPRTKGKQPLYY